MKIYHPTIPEAHTDISFSKVSKVSSMTSVTWMGEQTYS